MKRGVWGRLAVGAWGLAWSMAAGAADDTLRIGVIASYSGPYADYGRQFDSGIALYLKEHGGRIRGRKVEIIRKDTSGAAPDLAKRYAQELAVRHKVHVITGLDFSPNAYAVGAVADRAKVPVVVMNAASSGITDKSDYTVRVSFTVQQVSAPMAAWAAREGIREVFTVVADYASGIDAETAFGKAFAQAGGRIVGSVRTPVNNPDFAPYVQRIKDLKPQAVFVFFPSGIQPPAFLKAFQERGLAEAGIRLLATGEATDDNYLDATGDVALGLVTSHHYSFVHPSEKNRKFVRDFADTFGERMRPSYFAVAAYDGMAAVAEALGRTGGDASGPRLLEALKGLAFESPRGPIEIDARTRDIVQNVYIRRVEKAEGRLVNTEFDVFERVADPAKPPSAAR